MLLIDNTRPSLYVPLSGFFHQRELSESPRLSRRGAAARRVYGTTPLPYRNDYDLLDKKHQV